MKDLNLLVNQPVTGPRFGIDTPIVESKSTGSRRVEGWNVFTIRTRFKAVTSALAGEARAMMPAPSIRLNPHFTYEFRAAWLERGFESSPCKSTCPEKTKPNALSVCTTFSAAVPLDSAKLRFAATSCA